MQRKITLLATLLLVSSDAYVFGMEKNTEPLGRRTEGTFYTPLGVELCPYCRGLIKRVDFENHLRYEMDKFDNPTKENLKRTQGSKYDKYFNRGTKKYECQQPGCSAKYAYPGSLSNHLSRTLHMGFKRSKQMTEKSFDYDVHKNGNQWYCSNHKKEFNDRDKFRGHLYYHGCMGHKVKKGGKKK